VQCQNLHPALTPRLTANPPHSGQHGADLDGEWATSRLRYRSRLAANTGRHGYCSTSSLWTRFPHTPVLQDFWAFHHVRPIDKKIVGELTDRGSYTISEVGTRVAPSPTSGRLERLRSILQVLLLIVSLFRGACKRARLWQQRPADIGYEDRQRQKKHAQPGFGTLMSPGVKLDGHGHEQCQDVAGAAKSGIAFLALLG
jgi:hypothetical protein